MNNQDLTKIKNLLNQIKRENISEKRQLMIVQILELIVPVLGAIQNTLIAPNEHWKWELN